ncbi:ArnT family glycosyltransferase [Methanospirillum lacunae]|uniref:Glycosyl transferase n=1 Tax=Methanospirillum lacunae TaxID=668570 RepID=A0A2V2MWC1_9EURY|nr:glycosyltransferase family 39 protein [Methanospirillum lacunae]PWR72192.1 glycosyl transferase [Methanospirillum lacunae]
MNLQSDIRTYRHELILVGILIMASVFLLFNLAKEGYSNSYYAASVKSMLTNPGIMIYNSFDPTGFVTVDKPPVSLWVQTVSAALLGFSGPSVILPQALAGICSVLLLYLLVSRSWGKEAGLVAAFALTITPIFVAVARTNNMDGLLIFVLLGAVFLAVTAWKTGSPWYLVGSAVLIGIGFNIKMIQAFAVVPACFGIYLLNFRLSWKKKILHLAPALVVLILVSASWALMMDLTPADQRPYIGSSTDNSEFNLIFGYNGLNRLLGGFMPFRGGEIGGNRSLRGGSPGAFPDGSGGVFPPGINGGFGDPGSDLNITPPEQGSLPDGTDGSMYEPGGRFFAGPPGFAGNGTPGTPPFGMEGGRPGGNPGMNDGGEPGFFRMGDSGMSGQISWFLPFALIGLLAWVSRPRWSVLTALSEKEILTIALTLWLVPELLYFSFTSGFYHTYYVVMVAIPLAGLVGIGAFLMYDAYQKPGIKGWLFIAAIIATGACQWIFLRYNPDFLAPLSWIVLAGSILGAIVLAFLRTLPVSSGKQTLVVLLTVGLLCVAPFAWSCTSVIFKGEGNMPSAGPGLVLDHGQDSMRPGEFQGNSSAVYLYLVSHQAGEKYLVGVESSRSADDLIIKYGAPVMAMGGYSGGDNILTNESLKTLIHNGKIRFFLLGQNGQGMPGRKSGGITQWIQDSCPVVPEREWNDETNPGNSTSMMRNTLYDCKGVV